MILVFSIGLIEFASAQSVTLEFASMLPLSGGNSLTGIGKGASFGYQTDVSYNVRVRANFEMQFFNGNQNSIISYGTKYNWPNPDITYEIKNSIINMRYTEFSIGYDYFSFRSHPNMYIGPDLFVSKATANVQRVSDYENYQELSIAFLGGLKIHYGIEKKLKSVTFFGEYAAAFAAHTPYVGVESKFISFGLNHQLGIGFRF